MKKIKPTFLEDGGPTLNLSLPFVIKTKFTKNKISNFTSNKAKGKMYQDLRRT